MLNLVLLYFGFYFSFGAGIVYFVTVFSDIGVTSSMQGMIFSLGSLLAMSSQPFSGFIADKTRKDKEILAITMGVIALVAIIFFFAQTPLIGAIVFVIYFICCNVMMPLMDGLAVSSHFKFGNIRLWGSVGFACGSLVSGKIISMFSNKSFLIVVFIAAVLTVFAILRIKNIAVKEHEKAHFKDIKKLIHNKPFVLFIIFSILVTGAVSTHNLFFTSYFENIGGTPSSLGVIIFLMTLSEVPMMRSLGWLTNKFGSKNLLLFSGIAFATRWALYCAVPIPAVVAWTFMIQGLTSGIYYGVASAHVKTLVPKQVISTAVTITLASGAFGAIFLQGLSGKIIDLYGVRSVYFLFTTLTLCGIFIFVLDKFKKSVEE